VAYLLNQDQINWDKFKYMVFDIPNQPGTYKERYDLLGNDSPPPKQSPTN